MKVEAWVEILPRKQKAKKAIVLELVSQLWLWGDLRFVASLHFKNSFISRWPDGHDFHGTYIRFMSLTCFRPGDELMKMILIHERYYSW